VNVKPGTRIRATQTLNQRYWITSFKVIKAIIIILLAKNLFLWSRFINRLLQSWGNQQFVEISDLSLSGKAMRKTKLYSRLWPAGKFPETANRPMMIVYVYSLLIFLEFQISIVEFVVSMSLLPCLFDKRTMTLRLRLKIEIKRHSKCNSLYLYKSNFISQQEAVPSYQKKAVFPKMREGIRAQFQWIRSWLVAPRGQRLGEHQRRTAWWTRHCRDTVQDHRWQTCFH